MKHRYSNLTLPHKRSPQNLHPNELSNKKEPLKQLWFHAPAQGWWNPWHAHEGCRRRTGEAIDPWEWSCHGQHEQSQPRCVDGWGRVSYWFVQRRRWRWPEPRRKNVRGCWHVGIGDMKWKGTGKTKQIFGLRTKENEEQDPPFSATRKRQRFGLWRSYIEGFNITVGQEGFGILWFPCFVFFFFFFFIFLINVLLNCQKYFSSSLLIGWIKNKRIFFLNLVRIKFKIFYLFSLSIQQ